jgi:hypothetical protein
MGRCQLLLTGRTEHLEYFAAKLAAVAKHVFVLQKVYDAVCKAPLLGYEDQLLPAIESEDLASNARTETRALLTSSAPSPRPAW